MNKEEKEAIDRLDRKLTIEKFTKNIGIPVYIKDVEVVLNLIQKQEKEIQKSRKKNNDLLSKLRNRIKQVNKLAKYSNYKKEFSSLNRKIEKQETIIDKMAEKINQAYFDKENMYIWFEEKILPKDEFGLCEYKDLGTRKTRIKEYFKKEVEKE